MEAALIESARDGLHGWRDDKNGEELKGTRTSDLRIGSEVEDDSSSSSDLSVGGGWGGGGGENVMMGAEVSVVMISPIESTDIESYNQSDQLMLYVITSA